MTIDLTASIAPRSDQLNAEDFLTGPRTFTVERVTQGSAEQPFDFHMVEAPGRAYRPSKSMRRVIVTAWGPDATAYTGRRITLYRDPEVTFGRDKVGGIKISHLSHLDKRLELALTVTRGKRAKHTIEPLVESTPPAESIETRRKKAVDWFAGKGVERSNLEGHVGKPVDEWTGDDLDELLANAEQIAGGVA